MTKHLTEILHDGLSFNLSPIYQKFIPTEVEKKPIKYSELKTTARLFSSFSAY